MITKLIHSQSFDFDGPSASLVPLHSRGVDQNWIVKTASTGMFHKFLQDFKPPKGMTVIHTLAVGDEEFYGPNRNGDGFSREDNRTAHRSFVDLGHVYKNHQNDDPFKAVGEVLRSAHNAQMSRIELLIGLDNDKCRSEIQALERGEDLPVSMGCFTAGHRLTLEDGTTILLEDAVEGQFVLTHMGRCLPITHVFDKKPYTGTLYTLRAPTVDPIEATEEHPFFIVRHEDVLHTGYKSRRVDHDKLSALSVEEHAEWVPVKDVAVGDYLVTPVKAARVDSGGRRGGQRLRVGEFILTPVKEISTREVVDEPIYNIEVMRDNSYVINGVAVHNSMQDYDLCSVCGHRAPTAATHCHHIQQMLGQILEDGRRVYMKNPNPKYFDISVVFKPADRIAYALRKVAAAHGHILGGHELAEMVGLTNWANPKYATLRALATLYKRVPAHLRKVTEPQELKEASVRELRKQAQIHGIDQLLGFLHANGWLLSPGDFGQVIGHPSPESCRQAVETHGSLEDLMDDHTEVKALAPPSYQERIPLSHETQQDLKSQAGMDDADAQGRVIRITIVKPTQMGKSAHALEPAEARGFSDLYGHYKLAFANAHHDRPTILRNLASTF